MAHTNPLFGWHLLVSLLERQLAAGVLLDAPEEARQARIRLTRWMAAECGEMERRWAEGGEIALKALKDFIDLREDFWSALENLGEDGLRSVDSADAFCELFSSCPEILFQMFSFSRRGKLANRAIEIAQRHDTKFKFCDRALYVAHWFKSFEQYLQDHFVTSQSAVDERLEIARRLKNPVLMFFALCDSTRNKVRLASDGKTQARQAALEPLREAESVLKQMKNPRFRCYWHFYEGWAAYYFGDVATAEICLQKSEIMAREVNDYPVLGRILIGLSRVSRKRKEWKQAEVRGLAALEFGKSPEQNEIQALAARNLSRIYELKKEFGNAADYEERWCRWKEEQEHPTLPLTRKRLAMLRREHAKNANPA